MPRGFEDVTGDGKAHPKSFRAFPDQVLNDECYLLQRPFLQEIRYFPVFLHPLLERHLGLHAFSRLDQVIRKNNQHPIPISTRIETIISFARDREIHWAYR